MNEENKQKIDSMLKSRLGIDTQPIKSTNTILRNKNTNNVSKINRKPTLRNKQTLILEPPPPPPPPPPPIQNINKNLSISHTPINIDKNDTISVNSIEYTYKPNIKKDIKPNNSNRCCQSKYCISITIILLFVILIVINNIILFYFTNLSFN